MNPRSLITALLLASAWTITAPSAEAYYRRGAYYHNPYTGGYGGYRSYYNPYTGGRYQRSSGYNPYTGNRYGSRSYYNPYTGRSGNVQAAYNPYTGRYAYHYGYGY